MRYLRLLIIALLGLCFIPTEDFAQCVQCKPSQINPNALSCQSSSSGGNECSPSSDGQSCLIAGVCPVRPRGGDDGPPVGEGPNGFAQSSDACFKEKIGKVEFDENIVREVGEKHARLAIALAWLNQSGFLGTKDVKIYLAPLEINNDVYNKWLNNISAESQETALSATTDRSTSKLEKLPSPPKGAEPIVYAVYVVAVENSNNKIIKFSAVKGSSFDPAFTSLELLLEEVGVSESLAKPEKKWKVTSWELK